MKKNERLANGYTKWCLLSDGWGGETIDELWYSRDLNPWLIGDEGNVADEIEWCDWDNNKLRNFARKLKINMLNIISDEATTNTYTIMPVYSYRLKREQNKKLVDAFIYTFVVDPLEFLEYHKRDLLCLIGKKAYKKMFHKYKNDERELP